jgi:hypothetical protein
VLLGFCGSEHVNKVVAQKAKLVGALTKSRVQHVQSHLVALLRACDCDQTLVAVISGFVNLDHAATKLAYLVDLCTTLTDDGADHVVGDEDLLCERLSGHRDRRLVGCTAVWYRRGTMRGTIGTRLGSAAVVSTAW